MCNLKTKNAINFPTTLPTFGSNQKEYVYFNYNYTIYILELGFLYLCMKLWGKSQIDYLVS